MAETEIKIAVNILQEDPANMVEIMMKDMIEIMIGIMMRIIIINHQENTGDLREVMIMMKMTDKVLAEDHNQVVNMEDIMMMKIMTAVHQITEVVLITVVALVTAVVVLQIMVGIIPGTAAPPIMVTAVMVEAKVDMEEIKIMMKEIMEIPADR
jgi:hypothetical protein